MHAATRRTPLPITGRLQYSSPAPLLPPLDEATSARFNTTPGKLGYGTSFDTAILRSQRLA